MRACVRKQARLLLNNLASGPHPGPLPMGEGVQQLTPFLSARGFFVRILHYLCDSISFRLRGRTALFLFGHFLMMLFKFKSARPLRRNSDVLKVASLLSHWSFLHDEFPLSGSIDFSL